MMKDTQKNLDNGQEDQKTPDELKREFIKKFGKFALSAPMGMYLLMSPSQASANNSDILDDTGL